jgi:hypothetical protein
MEHVSKLVLVAVHHEGGRAPGATRVALEPNVHLEGGHAPTVADTSPTYL